MSADLLRKAAALMRERATHPDVSNSPWVASPHGDVHDDGSLWVCDAQSGEAAEHIASWHPGVALAVADWLDAAADDWDRSRAPIPMSDIRLDARAALAVARAYIEEAE